MYIKRFIDQDSKTQTYLIKNQQEAVIIDPVFSQVDDYVTYIKDNKLSLIYTLDTHVHADHITGSAYLRDQLGCKIVMSEYSPADCVDVTVSHNQTLALSDFMIKVLYTPGHTKESCCFLIGDRLFTGDTLLINACGRTDFQNGSSNELYDSIFHILLTLPDDYLVYPGHDYNNRTVSTIGEEKLNNPRLQSSVKAEFVSLMDNLNLPKPKYIDVAVPRNLLCGLEN